MKRVYLIARKNMINPSTGESYNDEQLKTLDCIRYSAVKTIADSADAYDLLKPLIEEFESQNPDFEADSYTLQVVEG